MSTLTQAPSTGFSFENTLRNSSLANKNLGLPKATSTGTTIVGCLYENGIVLGADTRATEGPIVADKNCEKVTEPLLSLDLSNLSLIHSCYRSTSSLNISDAVVLVRQQILNCKLLHFSPHFADYDNFTHSQ